MAVVETISDERRNEIVWLLTHRNDHLPLPVRHVAEASGFVNEPRERSCPDCLANGRTMPGCETCGGGGVVQFGKLGRVAIVDELPDDGQTRDPYAKNDVVGVDVTRHEKTRERDATIARLHAQTRPPRKEAVLLEEANRRGFAWEEARRAMYRAHDFSAIDFALDVLRRRHPEVAHVVNAVYVDGWMAEVGLITPLAEQVCEQGLWYLNALLPAELRTGLAPPHPAYERRTRRRVA